MAEASLRQPMRLLAYGLMPNHFHFVLWPVGDHDISKWMHWLMTSYVSRYRRHDGLRGHLWQGRFKPFAVQDDDHLLTVIRYVERNPMRAHLVDSCDCLGLVISGVSAAGRANPSAARRPRRARGSLAGARGATFDRCGTGRGPTLRRTRNSLRHTCVDRDDGQRSRAGVHAA